MQCENMNKCKHSHIILYFVFFWLEMTCHRKLDCPLLTHGHRRHWTKIYCSIFWILIFSPASYLGLGHLVGRIFLEKCDQSFRSYNVVVLIFLGWYGMLENHSERKAHLTIYFTRCTFLHACLHNRDHVSGSYQASN